jgi:rod shape determining protein RodA
MQLGIERKMMANAPWGVLLTAMLIALIGIYNLASASRPPNTPVWASQLVYLGVGLVALLVAAAIDDRFVQNAVVPIYVLNLALLIALKFVGTKAKGAESWLVLGPFRVQPAEFMKLGMVLMLAKYFHDDHRAKDEGYGILRLIVPVVLAVVPTALVLVQPDLGTALMMVFTAATMILFARVRWTVWALLGVCAVGGLGVMWNDWVRPQEEPRATVVRHLLKKHQDGRIAGWLDPEADLRGTNYHAMQSKIAVGSGGMTGKGWREGTQTGLRFLPEQHTDFIFSVWAEEQGLLKCLGLLVLYALLLTGAVGVAMGARDHFGAFVAVGIAAMIFWQVFENIGMVTGLLPVTGITLPLMSYGGSSMVSVMMGLGLLANVGMRRRAF